MVVMNRKDYDDGIPKTNGDKKDPKITRETSL